MFVTFIPSKQFERGWWTGECVNATPLGTVNKNIVRAMIPLVQGAHAVSAQTVPIADALQACASSAFHRYATGGQLTKKPHDHPPDLFESPDPELDQDNECNTVEKKKHESPTTLTSEENDAAEKCESPVVLYANVPKRIYKRWSGNSVALFQELSTVVVAGMHIVESADLQPLLTSLECPTDSVGNLLLPLTDNGTVTCPMKGKNLAKVKSLRLRSAEQSGFLDGNVVAASGDDSNATATFAGNALHALNKPDYAVYLVGSTGVETATTQVLHLDLQRPYVTGINPKTIDMAKITDSSTLELTGYQLGKVTEVHLSVKGSQSSASFKITTPEDGKAVAKLNVAELKKLGTTAGDLNCAVVVSGKEFTVAPELKFTPNPAPAQATSPSKPAHGSSARKAPSGKNSK